MTATEDVRRELTDLINADPSLEVTLDIEHLEIRAGNHAFPASPTIQCSTGTHRGSLGSYR